MLQNWIDQQQPEPGVENDLSETGQRKQLKTAVSGKMRPLKCNMTLKSPSALHIRPGDVLLVSDLDLQNVIALRLSINCVSITATVTSQIKNIPKVFGICSTVETVYVASSHLQEGGIFMFDYGDLLCSSEQLQIVVKNGTHHCNIVHGISLRTEDEIVYSDVSAKVVRTVSITEKSVKILSRVEGKEGHSDGSQGQFFQPTALCVELSSVFVCDTAGKR